MTPEQVDTFRQRLIAEQQALTETRDAARDSTSTVTLDQPAIGRLSRMDALQGQAMAIAAQQRRELQLKRIQSALTRIDADDYGFCLSCDEEISLPRLSSDPAITLCIACAAERERR